MKYVQVGLGHRLPGLRRALAESPGWRRLGLVLRQARTARPNLYTDLEQALEVLSPDLVVSLAPGRATADLARTAVAAGVPILALPPTGGDLDRFCKLADCGLVQLYQPSACLPEHAARLAVLGLIGAVSEVQIWSADPAQAIALIRVYLGVEPTRAVLQGHVFPGGEEMRVVSLDFGAGRRAIYRESGHGRGLIKGELGEISGDQVVTWADNLITTTYLQRRPSPGADGIWFGDRLVWCNPYPGLDWPDEVIAAASLLGRLGDWLDGGPPVVPLAEAVYEARLGAALGAAIGQSDPVEVSGPF